MRDYPDDETCLRYLWRTRYSPDGETAYCPKCERDRQFKRYAFATRRQSWDLHRLRSPRHSDGRDDFEKSSTSLQLWFYAIYLMTSTRCGISAKQLERELGVRYRTAEWGGYRTLAGDYDHRTIRHRDRIYVEGTTHTQTVEGFFGSSKNAIRGVYHGVSTTWLQGYLNEFAWGYNNRGDRNTMFRDLLTAATNTTVS